MILLNKIPANRAFHWDRAPTSSSFCLAGFLDDSDWQKISGTFQDSKNHTFLFILLTTAPSTIPGTWQGLK